MPSSLKTSFIGALQASLSVLLTLSYGILAAKWGFIHDTSITDISELCVKIFLPALLVTNIGSQLSVDALPDYVPIFLWAFVYALVSIAIGLLTAKFLKLPAWTAPAMAFNNSTSLPLLLVTSLAATGILKSIAGEDVDEAVQRAKSYFLINSMVSNTLTFALGPKIMDGDKDDSDSDNDEAEAEEQEEETNEETSLLPRPVINGTRKVQYEANALFTSLPPRVQSFLSSAAETVNPPMQGAILAAIIGLVPSLHTAFFAEMEHGGWMHAWLTNSIRNVGELFTALQMFVVGSELYQSLDSKKEVGPIPKRGLGAVFVVRFVLWPAISIPTVYALANHTSLLRNDPMVWFVMMLMPVGPPAMMLSALMQLKKAPESDKMAVARMLTYFYGITPIICFAVVGSLKACEAVLRR